MVHCSWQDLPRDIASKIAERIELYDDYESFGRVCSNWRLAIKQWPNHKYVTNKSPCQLPWLMLVDPDDSPYRRYYSLTKRQFLKIDLPRQVKYEDDQVSRYFSSQGWLISVTQINRRNMITLFNPFSKAVIQLPDVLIDLFVLNYGEWEDRDLVIAFGKFVLSASPNDVNDDNYVVAMVFEVNNQIALWKPGQDRWTKLVLTDLGFNCSYIHDVCFFRGELYGIGDDGLVMAFGDLSKNRPPRIIAKIAYNWYKVRAKFYLVECDSRLLVILKSVWKSFRKKRYRTKWFNVFELDVDNGRKKKVTSLRDQAIFVGYNSTFCVKATTSNGCEAGCIYYTDDNWDQYFRTEWAPNGGGFDLGIYNLALRKNRHYQSPYYDGPSRFSLVNPPLWLQLSS